MGRSPWTRSFQKDDEPLLNLKGAMRSCSREKLYVYTKEGTRVPSLNTGGLVCTRFTKQGVGVKCFNLGKWGKLIEQLLSTLFALLKPLF
jgi:hypothetical protein